MTQVTIPSNIRTQVKLALDQFCIDATRATHEHLIRTLNLASTETVLLMPQTLQGRMINGWWAPDFVRGLKVNYRYPNTVIEDAMKALGLNIAEEQQKRQQVINDIRDYFNMAQKVVVNNGNGSLKPWEHGMTLNNSKLEPLGGIKMFEGTIIGNPINVLMGAYIGGYVDSAEYRSKCEKKFGINMHKGICAPVNREKMNQHGLTLQGLAMMDNKGMTLEELVKKGIVSNHRSEYYSNGYVSGYIELNNGFSLSDDAAFLAVALLFNIEAAWGFLLMDAIDTWDKSAPQIYFGGQDEMTAGSIKRTYEAKQGRGTFPISENDILNVIYLAAIDQGTVNSFPSCSQRRFVEINPDTNLCPIQSHLAYIKKVKEGGYMPPSMRIAFQQVSTESFYGKFKTRYDEFIKKGEIQKAYNLPGNGS